MFLVSPSARFVVRFLTWATFAVWFGGFTFYVSIVVPTGTDVLGSARAQGAITRAVTPWLNASCGLAVLMILIDSGWPAPRDATDRGAHRARWIGLACGLGLLLSLIGLVVLHPRLDGMIEGEGLKIRISQRRDFYHWHRVYLWVSTLQWLVGWVWLAAAIRRNQPLRLAPADKSDRISPFPTRSS